MLKDILGIILSFSVENNQFQWLTVCKEWYEVGTELEIFKKNHDIYDLSIFLKTLTMIPRPGFSFNFVAKFEGHMFRIDYDWRDVTDEKHWYLENTSIVKTILPKGEKRNLYRKNGRRIVAIFFDEKQCERMFIRILNSYKCIKVEFTRWGIVNNYLTGYDLIDDLVSKKIISIEEGNNKSEKISFNMDEIFVHYSKNKEMYPQFAKEHLEIVDLEKNIYSDWEKAKKSNWCSIL